MKTKTTKFYIEYVLPTTKEAPTNKKVIGFLSKLYFRHQAYTGDEHALSNNKILIYFKEKENEKNNLFISAVLLRSNSFGAAG
jgi:hypothetical protein